MNTVNEKNPDRQKKTNSENAKSSGYRTNWPLPLQVAFAVFIVLFVGSVWVGLPVWSALQFIQNDSTVDTLDIWAPLLSVLVGLMTIIVTGIFVFMTFRIDRGTQTTAERVAKEVAKEKITETIDEILQETEKMIEDAKQKALDTAENTAKDTAKEEVGKFVDEAANRAVGEVKRNLEEAEKAARDVVKTVQQAEGEAKTVAEDAAKAAREAGREAKTVAEDAAKAAREAGEKVVSEVAGEAQKISRQLENEADRGIIALHEKIDTAKNRVKDTEISGVEQTTQTLESIAKEARNEADRIIDELRKKVTAIDVTQLTREVIKDRLNATQIPGERKDTSNKSQGRNWLQRWRRPRN